MKKLIIIAAISSLLTLQILGNNEEIEQAIDDSRPQKLEKILEKISLTDIQKEAYLIFADKILEFRKDRIAGRDLKGVFFDFWGYQFLALGILMVMPYIGDFISNNKLTNHRYKIVHASVLTPSFVCFFLGYLEKNKPIERSRRDEYMDALRIKEILTKLADHKELA